MELLSNNEKVHQVKETKQEVLIYFSTAWCQNVDGVRLFEMVSKISLDIKLKYEKGQIILVFHKKKADWLQLANKVLENIKKL